VVKEDSETCSCQEGGKHPTHQKPFPIAWVTVGKSYFRFHHMGIYARPDLLQGASKQLKAGMQGKSCFNFVAVDQPLFAELEELTVRGFKAFQDATFMK